MAQSPIPPPPDNPGDRPAAGSVPVRPSKPAPRVCVCPRCGYMCEHAWHFCTACGWDLTRLVGDAEERMLQTIAKATVGLTVSGRPNRHATAFPYGGPGLFLTSGRTLIAADPSGLKVRTHNNMVYPATIVGHDPASGIGLIRADIPGIPPLEAAPTAPSPPEPMWAVCYSVIFEDDLVRYIPVSLHRGQVTAAGQTGTHLVSLENLLRTDHTIRPGCAGGPLLDARGRLAGMILGGPDVGITYALPLEGQQQVLTALAGDSLPARPYLGIGLVSIDDRRRARFGLPPTAAGPLVAYVIRGSPAAEAGVRPGDLLGAVGGEPVAGVREAWMKLLAAAPDGPAIRISVVRGAAGVEAVVKPIQRPAHILLDPIDELQETLELNLKEIGKGQGAQAGLAVSDIVRGGRGEKELYQNGDIIVGVDDKTVRTFEEFDALIRTKFKKIFAPEAARERRYASSYAVKLQVRTVKDERVERDYVNLFPDFLAPPVY